MHSNAFVPFLIRSVIIKIPLLLFHHKSFINIPTYGGWSIKDLADGDQPEMALWWVSGKKEEIIGTSKALLLVEEL